MTFKTQWKGIFCYYGLGLGIEIFLFAGVDLTTPVKHQYFHSCVTARALCTCENTMKNIYMHVHSVRSDVP